MHEHVLVWFRQDLRTEDNPAPRNTTYPSFRHMESDYLCRLIGQSSSRAVLASQLALT